VELGRGSADSLKISRREFLGVSLGSGFLLVSDPLEGAEVGAELPTHSFKVRRAYDLLNLEFSFVNFEVKKGDLVALGQGRSLVIVRFPPQNLAEAIFDRPAPDPKNNLPIGLIPKAGSDPRLSQNSPIPPIRSFLSGPSWIVFAVPDGLRLPFRNFVGRSGIRRQVIDRWLRSLAEEKIRIPHAAEHPSKLVSMPRFDETCLEVPFRLFISPTSSDTRWISSSDRLCGVDAAPGRTRELWHAALISNKKLPSTQLPAGIKPEDVPPELRPPTRVMIQARAVFSPDYRADGKPPETSYYPGNLQLSHDSRTRHDLVKQMAAGDGLIDAEHLVLSALGADASLSYTSTRTFQQILQGQLNNDSEFDYGPLAAWKHRMVVGRDVFLLSVRFGFLFPFVYPALAVELTKRRFAAYQIEANAEKKIKSGFSAPGAYLLKERFILVVDPVKQFPNSGSSPGRKMPLKKAVVSPTRSPLLANWTGFRIKCDCEGGFEQNLEPKDLERLKNGLFFVPRLLEDQSNPGADGLRWNIEFEDEAEKQSKTSNACLLFAEHVVTGRKLWQALRPQFRRWSLPAQSISFAPEKAELSLLAENDTSDTSGQAVHIGQTLFRHTFADQERAAVRNLADVLRNANQGWNQYVSLVRGAQGNVARFANQVSQLVGSGSDLDQQRQLVERTLRNISPQTLKKFDEKITLVEQQLNKGFNKAQDVYEDVLRQFQRAEQATSTLETHMLAFDCAQVNNLFTSVDQDLAPFVQQVNTAEQFYEKVKNVDTLLSKDPAQNWAGRLQSELTTRLAALPSWEAKRREITAYLDELRNAGQQADQFGNQFFHAQVAEAEAVIPALKAMGNGSAIQPIQHLQDYLAKGMGDLGKGLSRVQNGAFARLNQAIDQGAAMADQVRCAVARPAAIVAGISRDLGALVGNGPDAINKLANQIGNLPAEQKPTLDDLKNAIPDAKLFSVLPLRDIIKALTQAGAIAKNQLPVINLKNLPDHFEQTWEWTTAVSSQSFGILDFKVEEYQYPASLHISSVTRVDTPKVDLSNTSSVDLKKLRGTITLRGLLGFWDEQAKKAAPETDLPAFHLVILGMIDVAFKSVEFSAEGPINETPKPSINPKIGDIQFQGPLKFVATLQEYLKSLLGDVFKLDITPEQLLVGFNIGPLGFAIGVVAIDNVAIGAALILSFTNKPLRFRFNFCSFDEPFTLTVMCFGGRGFFQAELATDGYRDLQGAIEFGGALDFSVPALAHGDLYVMAGFYFRLTNSQTDLSGYFRAGGNLYVLGLVHVSAEFLLAGRYRKEGSANNIYGIASLTISIDLFMFSFDVSVTMEKRIAGSSDSSSQSQSALDDRRPLFHFASFNRLADETQQPIGEKSYFARDFRPTPGRFDFDPRNAETSMSDWNQAYWSQFDFECAAGAM
jgi:hypothetical protein